MRSQTAWKFQTHLGNGRKITHFLAKFEAEWSPLVSEKTCNAQEHTGQEPSSRVSCLRCKPGLATRVFFPLGLNLSILSFGFLHLHRGYNDWSSP